MEKRAERLERGNARGDESERCVLDAPRRGPRGRGGGGRSFLSFGESVGLVVARLSTYRSIGGDGSFFGTESEQGKGWMGGLFFR